MKPAEDESFVGTAPLDERPTVEKLIPDKPEDWQKRPPCDEDQDEREVRGACWQATSRRPPCGTLYREGNLCLRPIKKAPRIPVGGEP